MYGRRTILVKKGVNVLNWLDKLERKFGRYAIPNLTVYLLAGYVIGFAVSYTGTVLYPARADLEDYFMGTDSTDGKSLFAFLFSTFVLFTGDSPGADMGDIPV